MEFDKKKVLALIGLVVVTIGIGFLIYTVFFQSDEAALPPEELPPAQTPGQGLSFASPAQEDTEAEPAFAFPTVLPTAALVPAAGGNQIVQVSPLITTPTTGVTVSGDGNALQFYNRVDGKFYRSDAEGNQVAMSDDSFPAAKQVTWAPDKANAIIEFPDGNKVVYDFDSKKQFSIPKHWNDIQFSPDSNKIVGKSDSPDPSLRYLFTARKDGTGATPIEPLGENGNKVIVNWSPNDQVVAFSKTGPAIGGGSDRQAVLMIGKNHENYKPLVVEGLGFEPKWSPGGDRVLYSAFNGASNLMPTLWVDGGSDETVGAAKSYLGINTWASKCTFINNDELMCAVPNPDNLITGIGFAPHQATNTDDTIYKINIKTQLQSLVAKPEGNRTLDELHVSENGDYLFMKDKATGEVLKMRLK